MIDVTIKLEQVICGVCGIHYSMPEEILAERRKDGRGFWCPNGHQVYYLKSTQKALDEKTVECARWEAEAQRLLAECDRLREELIAARVQAPRDETRKLRLPWLHSSKD